VLEDNDVAVLLRSDSLDHIAAGADALFGNLGDLFQVTSIRKGFVGGGFGPGESIPKKMAQLAGVPGASLIPEGSQLFMGFTSTQRSALAPDRIANLETLPGVTDQWPKGYFYRSSRRRPTSPETSPPFTRRGTAGSCSTRPVSAGSASTTTAAGRAKGRSLIQRADFNTLDNPFFWSAQPARDRQLDGAAAGLHFVAFPTTSDIFHRARRAMDGQLADGSSLPLDARARAQGLNSVIRATHR
jgi:hypothetical protein